MDNKEIGTRIKTIRKQRKLTQIEVANEAGISRSYYADVENGRYAASLETMSKIAKALKVSVSFILTGILSFEDLSDEDQLRLKSKFDNNIEEAREVILKELSNVGNYTKSQILSLSHVLYFLNIYKEYPEFLTEFSSLIHYLQISKDEFIQDDAKQYDELVEHAQTKIKWMIDKLK